MLNQFMFKLRAFVQSDNTEDHDGTLVEVHSLSSAHLILEWSCSLPCTRQPLIIVLGYEGDEIIPLKSTKHQEERQGKQ